MKCWKKCKVKVVLSEYEIKTDSCIFYYSMAFKERKGPLIRPFKNVFRNIVFGFYLSICKIYLFIQTSVDQSYIMLNIFLITSVTVDLWVS